MNDTLRGLLTVEQYREARSHVFASPSAIEWHIRTHKREWIEAGALLVIAGRRFINPAAADGLVLRIGQAAAQGVAA